MSEAYHCVVCSEKLGDTRIQVRRELDIPKAWEHGMCSHSEFVAQEAGLLCSWPCVVKFAATRTHPTGEKDAE